MVYSVTMEDSPSDSLSLTTNEIAETSTRDNIRTERLRESSEFCLQTGVISDGLMSPIPGRAISSTFPLRKTDILRNSVDRDALELNMQDNEIRGENRRRSLQISDPGLKRCKLEYNQSKALFIPDSSISSKLFFQNV